MVPLLKKSYFVWYNCILCRLLYLSFYFNIVYDNDHTVLYTAKAMAPNVALIPDAGQLDTYSTFSETYICRLSINFVKEIH